MKRIIAAEIAVALLIGTLAPMAAAGIFLGDMIGPGITKCGTIQVVGSLVILILNMTGACAPSSTTDLALCASGGTPEKLTPITDTNGNGKINGNEGIFKGVLASYTAVSGLEVWSGVGAGDFFCTTSGAQQYYSGWHK
jgi:hypothetical protein